MMNSVLNSLGAKLNSTVVLILSIGKQIEGKILAVNLSACKPGIWILTVRLTQDFNFTSPNNSLIYIETDGIISVGLK